jgi:hypothetical protein
VAAALKIRIAEKIAERFITISRRQGGLPDFFTRLDPPPRAFKCSEFHQLLTPRIVRRKRLFEFH